MRCVSACSEQCGKAVLVPHVPDRGPGAGAVGHREHQHRSCHLHDQNAVASDEAAEARGGGQRVLQLRAPASPSHDSLRRIQGNLMRFYIYNKFSLYKIII